MSGSVDRTSAVSDMDAASPLDGVRVIDFTTMLAGPYCTMLLADLGADVVKVEPLDGDGARSFGPFLEDDHDRHYGGYFQSTNHNKRSIAIDLSTPQGVQLALELIDTADILVENYRPGVMDRLGLSFEVLSARRPPLVYAAIRGFGDPRTGATSTSDWPAFDLIAQALGGLMSITGPDPDTPLKSGPGIGDIFPAVLASTGLLAALYRAHRTGKGRFVDVSMYDSVIALCERIIYQYSYEGDSPKPQGNSHPLLCPFDTFPTTDGWIAIAAPYDHQWALLCMLTGIPNSPGSTSLAERNAHAPTVREAVKAWTHTRSKAEILQRIGGYVPCAPVQSARDLFSDPDVRVRNMLVTLEHPGSITPVTIAGRPIKFAGVPPVEAHSAPLIGEHTDQILASLGISMATIRHLRRGAIVA